MIGAKLSDQRNSSNAGRFKSTNQRLASRGYLASARENRAKEAEKLIGFAKTHDELIIDFGGQKGNQIQQYFILVL